MSVLLSLCLDEAAKPEQNNESLSVPLYQEIKNVILNLSVTIKYLVNFFLLVHNENCMCTRNKFKLIKSVVVS